MMVEINRMREDVREKTETLESKNKEVAELQRRLESIEVNKSEKAEYLEDLVRQREISLSQLQEKSDRDIQSLREDLVSKEEALRGLEGELETLREKNSKFEQQFNELDCEAQQVVELKQKVLKLENELCISRGEATAASASKVRVIQVLAEELERLRYGYGGFISIRKNVLPASAPRSKKSLWLNQKGVDTAMHYSARV